MWGKPPKDSKEYTRLDALAWDRVEHALRWDKGEAARRNCWIDLDWLLQPWHLENSLSYRGLDRSSDEEKARRMHYARVSANKSFS